MYEVKFVKSRRKIAVKELGNPNGKNFQEKHCNFDVEELTDDGSVVIVHQPGQFYGQRWEYGKPYTWERLPTMYELPSEGPELEDVLKLEGQLQQERRLREQAEQRAEELAQRLRELGIEP
jgi:hypothetical protein